MARRNNKAAAGKAKNRVSVDFTGVETRVLLPEGVYNAKVDEIKLEDNDGKPYLSWKFKTIDDDPKLNDKPLYNNPSLQPQSLWVLGQLLDTLGVERPDGPMDIDFDELLGLELGLLVEHEEYQGKTRAKVVDFTPATEGEDGDVKVEDDSGDDDEKYTEESVNEMDADELDELVEKHELGVKKLKKIDKYRAAVIAALEEADLIGEEDAGEEGDEDGDDESEGYTKDEINEMDADELGELVEKHELDVKPMKKIAKYREAVIEALDEEDLIKEDDEDEDEGYTEDEINEMDAKELAEVVEKHELDVEPQKKIAKYRSAVIDALEAEDLIKDDD